MLVFRSLFAAMTINSILWYFWSGNIGYFNVFISAWCFMEWMNVFNERQKLDVLDWILPPLNQFCLLIRAFASEITKIF